MAARRDVAAQQKDGNDEAAAHYEQGNREIAAARNDAEKEAREKREQARNESEHEGFFSRIGHAIGSFFDSIRDAIHKAFDWARKLVTAAINRAKKFASDVIDRVRNTIVGLIRKVGDALIAIGDRVLAAFPKLREKFRAAIHKLVDSAVAAVNKLADALKKAVKKLLDLLGKALTSILDAYEAIYMAVVNAAASAINSAINAVKAIITAIGVFAALIRDIASGPGQWLRNLGAALLDGVRNHLWAAFKAAVKEWFNSKVEAVVGIGKLIFDVLRKGGIAFSRVAKMVWVAVKSAIPRAIIEFLIQKVISMLVPAAAAIMAIIEGLQAAWATASRVIAALDLFVTFLKAVKGGNAGPQFAKALAAAVIVVIDFTANFIISKIGKGAKGVGSKLKGIAAKIMAWLKRGVRAIGRGVKRVGRLVVRGARAVGRGLKAAGRYIARSGLGRGVRAAARWVAKTRAGKAVARGWAAAKKKAQDLRERFRKWRENRRKNKEKNDTERLDKAVTALRPRLHTILPRGVGNIRLRAMLAAWRLWYRIKKLAITGDSVVAANSPEIDIAKILVAHQDQIFRIVHDASVELLIDPDVLAAFARIDEAHRGMEEERATGPTDRISPMIPIGAGASLPAAAMALENVAQRGGSTRGYGSVTGLVGAPSIFFEQTGRTVGMTRTGGPGLTYAAMLRGLDRVATRPMSDQAMAAAVARFARSGEVDRAFRSAEGQMALAEATRVVFSVKSSRSIANVVESPLVLEQVASGKATMKEAFGRDSPINPMTAKGAVWGSRRLEQEILDPSLRRSRDKRVVEARKRRIELMTKVISQELALRQLTFENEAQLMDWVRKNLKPILLRHARALYGLPERVTAPFVGSA